MKRSPTTSSCSSSSSCIGSDIPHQSVKLKPKRARKTHNPDKCLQIAAAAAAGGGRRSSIYRGVTRSIFLAFSLMGFRLHVRYSCLIIISRHRWTGRFEAHLWDKSSWNNIQNKKGRQGNLRIIFSFFFMKYIFITEIIKEISAILSLILYYSQSQIFFIIPLCFLTLFLFLIILLIATFICTFVAV